ncbi:ATP-binding protein [Myxococcus sp. 1LA]
MKHSSSNLELPLLPDGRDEQFRLVRLQTLNWGTFRDLCDIPIPETGYLFVGPSGSGKSTLLDAHAALLTPPKWVDFNVAAREAERVGKDRNLVSYIRGAWAHQTGDNGEHSAQYLRSGTTWSAIAETYRNARGRVVVLAQVLWIRGNSCSPTDVRKLHVVVQRELDLRSLEFFPKSDFDVRRVKHELPEAFVREEFSAYQERFRGLLGIDSERALRLLHKTQSAKNLGDLNVFLRDFMLDPPETFATADRLVGEFAELHAAHQAVVAARQQIETLAPARTGHADLLRVLDQKVALDELAVGVDVYCEQKREELLTQRIDKLAVEAEGARQEALHLSSLLEGEYEKLTLLRSRRDGLSSGLSHLTRQLEMAQHDRPARLQRRQRALDACTALGWKMPESAPTFVHAVSEAKGRLEQAAARTAELERHADTLKEQRRLKEEEFQGVRAEIDAMERHRSNVPAQMLAIRARIAQALGLAEEELPFAGELIEVEKNAAAWRGAIERVLHGFALSMLVDDQHYAVVSSFVNENEFRQRLVYLRMLPRDGKRSPLGANSLVRKLTFAQAPQAMWVRQELTERFDYECAETIGAFRNAARAVTQQGQIKHNHSRHEKDDRHNVDDRRRWVLGFDNREKLKLYKDRAGELAAELANLERLLADAKDQREQHRQEQLHCQTLANLTWAEVDLESLLARIAELEDQITTEKAAIPELTELDAQIATQQARHSEATDARNAVEARKLTIENERAKLERARAELPRALLSVRLTPSQAAGLGERFAGASRKMSLETLELLTKEVDRGIRGEVKQCELRMGELRRDVERQLSEFNRRWPAESGGLDATLESAEDYFAKLTRLETDGLPRFENRFMQLLQEQSDQNLTLLSTRLDLERSAIRERLELVNESLATTPFNPGTRLVIEPLDRALEEVRQFKQSLKEALTHSFSDDPVVAEKRFLVLSALVKRLGSQETADRSWRDLVLDVRLHVEFVARELDESGLEVEIYRSGAGKSGGQRQKLAATCLAAALRYQLGGRDRALPSFATVVLDEAFDKADSEFTSMAMNIFETFGFQMVVATPLKSVMTLEPFIGGACFVHIRDRKSSSYLLIPYDAEEKRLKLPEHVRDGEKAAAS